MSIRSILGQSIILLALFVLISSFTFGQVSFEQNGAYILYDLGGIDGSTGTSQAMGISENGVSVIKAASIETQFEGAIVTDGAIEQMGAGTQNVRAVNDFGVAVGDALSSSGSAFKFENGQKISLSGLVGATDISNEGIIVGGDDNNAVIWDSGQITSLGEGWAFAINNQGQVVGKSGGMAVLWENGEMISMTPVVGALAADINNLGQAVGHTWVSEGGVAQPTGFIWQNNQLTTLPRAPDGAMRQHPWSINDQGQIVGTAQMCDNCEEIAVLWENGELKNLNNLIDSNLHEFPRRWRLHSATGISEDGWIVGMGRISGSPYNQPVRAFLLKPNPGGTTTDTGYEGKFQGRPPGEEQTSLGFNACSEQECVMGDSGDDIYNKGTDSYHDWIGGSVVEGALQNCIIKTGTDFCIDEDSLFEYHCTNTLIRECPDGYHCSDGACRTGDSCSNECIAESSQCDGGGVKICGDYDADSCLEWSTITACSSGLDCVDGECVATNSSTEQNETVVVTNTSSLSQSAALLPKISTDPSGAIHITWQENNGGLFTTYYSKFSSDTVPVITRNSVWQHPSAALNIEIASGSMHILHENASNDLSLTTTAVDSAAPVISNIEFSDITGDTATLRFTTDEPARVSAHYDFSQPLTMSKSSGLDQNHGIVLTDLTSGADHLVEIVATDVFGNTVTDNNNFNYHRFTAGISRIQPELPTTIYGQVLFVEGGAAEDIAIDAEWTDTIGATHVTTTQTLTQEEADALNDSSLVGYFFFNKGLVQAKRNTGITVSAHDGIHDSVVLARPGGDSVEVDPALKVDLTPPQITIHSPEQILHQTTQLILRYSVNEPIVAANFTLNGAAPVSITDLVDSDIHIVAIAGENILTIEARDFNGKVGSATISFQVQDTTPPTVDVVSLEEGSGVVSLSAAVSDSGLLSQSCEVCISSDGLCDTEWTNTNVVNDFGSADLAGLCKYDWDTTSVLDGTYYFNFRVYDSEDHLGFGSTKSIVVDNTAPDAISGLSVAPISGEASLRLLWSENQQADFSHYRIYKSSGYFSSVVGIESLLEISDQTQNTYTDTELESSATFYYAVTAVDESGNENTAVSSIPGTVSDLINPSITIHSPKATAYDTKTIPIAYDVSEPTQACYGLLNGVNYTLGSSLTAVEGVNTFQIRCFDNANNLGESTKIFSVDTTAPDQIFSLTTSTLEDGIELNWDAVGNVSFYRIYRALESFSVAENELDTTTANTYTDTSVSSSETYYYAVTGVDDLGNENTNVVSVIGRSADTIPPELSISSPSGLVEFVPSLDYSSNEDLTNCTYVLNGDPVVDAATPLNVLEGDNTLTLTCFDLAGNEGEAAVDFEANLRAPQQITSLVVSATAGSGTLQLNWEQPTDLDLDDYRVYRSDSSFSDISLLSPLATTSATSYTDAGLESEAVFYYAVVAVDTYGSFDTSVISVVGLVADTVAPEALEDISVTAVADEPSLDVSWPTYNGNDFAAYKIYRSASPFTLIKTVTDRSETSFTDTELESGKTYTYKITVVDINGNENTTVPEFSATVSDLIGPVVSIISPSDQTYTSTTLDLSYTVDEETSSCEYSLNSGAYLAVSDSIVAGDGDHSLTVRCTDVAGNVGESAPVSFSVDSTPPSAVSGLSVTTLTQKALDLEWSENSESDFLFYEIYRSENDFSDISSMSPLTTDDASPYRDYGVNSEGTYYYAVVAVDIAGNKITDISTVSGTVYDLTPPDLVENIVVETIPAASSLDISWSASSAPDFKEYRVYRSQSAFSSVEGKQPITTTTELSYTDPDLTSELTYYYAVTAVDANNNENKQVVSVSGVVADMNPPIIALTSPTDTAYNSITIDVTYISSEPVTDCTYRLHPQGPKPLTDQIDVSEGANNIKITCSDLSGNSATSNAVDFTVDTTAPVAINNLVIASVAGEEKLILSWDAAVESDVDHYNVYRLGSFFTSVLVATKLDETQETTHTDTTVENEQTYYYAVTATDAIGNEETNVDSTIGVVPDVIKPVVSIQSPQNIVYGTNEITLDYSVNEDVAWCVFRLNDNANVSISQAVQVTAAEGDNTLAVYCSDTTNNIGSATVVFKIDFSAPAPISGLVVTPVPAEDAISLVWDASPEPDVDHYNIYRSLTDFSDVSDMAPLTQTNPTSLKNTGLDSEQTYYYAVTAVDQFDNENPNVVAKSATVADTVPPAPILGLTVTGSELEVALTLSWNPSTDNQFLQYNIYKDDSLFSSVNNMLPLLSTTETNYFDSNVLEGKTYYYAVTALDTLENENETVQAVFGATADVTPPIVTLTQIGSKITGQTLLSAAVLDIGSGLAHSCEVCISSDLECDDEWIFVDNSFSVGDSNGTCLYSWDTSADSEGTYTINFRISDVESNQREGEVLQTQLIHEQVNEYDIPLQLGWNLISIPLVPIDNSVEAVLSPIAGKYKRAFYFNTDSNSWESFKPNRLFFDAPNTLLTIDVGKGYWIETTEAVTLRNTGTQLSSFSMELSKGWNYIGYPYIDEGNISLSLGPLSGKYHKIYSYNVNDQKWDVYKTYDSLLEANTLTSLKPGLGYVIDMSADAQWTP